MHDINEDIHNQHFDYNISSSLNNTLGLLDNHNNHMRMILKYLILNTTTTSSSMINTSKY